MLTCKGTTSASAEGEAEALSAQLAAAESDASSWAVLAGGGVVGTGLLIVAAASLSQFRQRRLARSEAAAAVELPEQAPPKRGAADTPSLSGGMMSA